MGTHSIPEDLRRFILTSVPSVPFVEAMLIFRESEQPVSIELLAKRLYVGERQSAEIVEQLRSARLIEPSSQDAGHRYAPAPEITGVVEQLAAYYRSHLVEVTSLIHSRTGRMAQHFADAFRLRKD